MGGQDRAGTSFGHYELRRIIGRGGMGEVYEAHDSRRDRTVALKLLPTELAHDAEFRERFAREARTAARLQDPHVIPIHDFGEIDGQLYIDMRLVQGSDLRQLLRSRGRLTPAAALDVVRQVGDALDSAHADGLVHRDVKPANVLVLPSGFVYLVDFGIATRADEPRLTISGGAAVGSLAYMAPERFTDGAVTGAADIYGLGCLLYELLTGSVPFRRDSLPAQMSAHLHEEPPPASALRPDLPAGIDAVVARAMAKDPAARFGSAREMTAQLAQVLGDDVPAPGRALGAVVPRADAGPTPTGVSPVAVAPVPAPISSAPRRRRGLIAAVGAFAILLGAAAVAVVEMATGDDGADAAAATRTDGSTARTPQQSIAGSGTRDIPSSSDYETSSTSRSTSTSTTTTTTSTDPTTTTTTTVTTAPTSSSATSTAEPDVGATIAPGAGHDWQGWVEAPSASCNADDRALVITRTQYSWVVICEVGPGGRTYYKGARAEGGLEIDDPVRSGPGWVATNRGHDYDVQPDYLRIRKDGEQISAQAVLEWYSV